MRTAQRQAEQVLRGERRAAYFCGPPGVGKSYVLEEAIRTSGAQALHARPRSARELVDLFAQATKETPIILQECDHLFRSEHSLNILKLATEKHGQAVRVYVGARGAKKPGTWETVRLTAPVMFTLNKALTKPSN